MFNFPFDICINIQFSMVALNERSSPKPKEKYSLYSTDRESYHQQYNAYQNVAQAQYLNMVLKLNEITTSNYKITQH